MPLPVTTPPVKRRLERPAGRDKRESKNNSSADIARAQAEAILNHSLPETTTTKRGTSHVFGFQLTCGLMMVFYGYSVMKNPRVWGDQGRRAVKPEHFEEYGRQNGLFFLKAGCVMAVIGALDALVTLDALLYLLLYVFGFAFAFYPLTRWCKANEGFCWPWPHVKSEKKRINELRKEQEQQEKK